MRIISSVILISLLFTNIAYPFSTLRVPVGEIESERSKNLAVAVFLLLNGRKLSKDDAASYLEEERQEERYVLILSHIVEDGRPIIIFEEMLATRIPEQDIDGSDVYSLKLGERFDRYPQFDHVLVTSPIDRGRVARTYPHGLAAWAGKELRGLKGWPETARSMQTGPFKDTGLYGYGREYGIEFPKSELRGGVAGKYPDLAAVIAEHRIRTRNGKPSSTKDLLEGAHKDTALRKAGYKHGYYKLTPAERQIILGQELPTSDDITDDSEAPSDSPKTEADYQRICNSMGVEYVGIEEGTNNTPDLVRFNYGNYLLSLSIKDFNEHNINTAIEELLSGLRTNEKHALLEVLPVLTLEQRMTISKAGRANL